MSVFLIIAAAVVLAVAGQLLVKHGIDLQPEPQFKAGVLPGLLKVFSSPWVGDLEGDGRADIVVGANNGLHLIRDVGPLGRVAWPTFHRDERRTGALP